MSWTRLSRDIPDNGDMGRESPMVIETVNLNEHKCRNTVPNDVDSYVICFYMHKVCFTETKIVLNLFCIILIDHIF